MLHASWLGGAPLLAPWFQPLNGALVSVTIGGETAPCCACCCGLVFGGSGEDSLRHPGRVYLGWNRGWAQWPPLPAPATLVAEQKLQAFRFGSVEIVNEGDLESPALWHGPDLVAGRSWILHPELLRPFGRALLPVWICTPQWRGWEPFAGHFGRNQLLRRCHLRRNKTFGFGTEALDHEEGIQERFVGMWGPHQLKSAGIAQQNWWANYVDLLVFWLWVGRRWNSTIPMVSEISYNVWHLLPWCGRPCRMLLQHVSSTLASSVKLAKPWTTSSFGRPWATLNLWRRSKKGIQQHEKSFDLPEEALHDGWADWWYDANDDPEQEQPPGAAASPTSPTRPTTSPTAAAAAEGSVGMSPIRRSQPAASFRSVGVPGTSAAARALARSTSPPWRTASSWVSWGASGSCNQLDLALMRRETSWRQRREVLSLRWWRRLFKHFGTNSSLGAILRPCGALWRATTMSPSRCLTRPVTSLGTMIGQMPIGAKLTTGLSQNGINGVICNTLNLNTNYKMMVLMILKYKKPWRLKAMLRISLLKLRGLGQRHNVPRLHFAKTVHLAISVLPMMASVSCVVEITTPEIALTSSILHTRRVKARENLHMPTWWTGRLLSSTTWRVKPNPRTRARVSMRGWLTSMPCGKERGSRNSPQAVQLWMHTLRRTRWCLALRFRKTMRRNPMWQPPCRPTLVFSIAALLLVLGQKLACRS